jgi:outer membrane cobalamin receptor
MKPRPSARVIYFLIGWASSASWAASNGSVISELPPVVVEAPQAEVGQTLSTTTAVRREQLESANQSDLDKALRGQPGITLQRATRGSLSTFSLRGATGGQGMMMLDGIPLYGALTGFVNLDGFPPELLDHVEVERGALGIRHGSQALAGTLRLFSRDESSTGLRLHLQGGSYGTMAGSGVGSLAGERGRITIAGKREDVMDGITQANAAMGNRERDGYRGGMALMRYSARPAEGLGVDGSFFHHDTRAEIDGIGLTSDRRPGAVDDLTAYGRSEVWLGQQRITLSPASTWETALQLGFHESRPTMRMGGVTVSSDSRLYLLRLRNAFGPFERADSKNGFKFAFGAEGRHEQSQGISPFGRTQAERTQAAGFADLEVWSGRWSATAGVRADQYQARASRATYYVGTGYQLASNFKLSASGGHGYRLPSLHELYFPFFGNPLLRPEAADSGQIGFEWNPWSDVQLLATGFVQRYTDLIHLSYAPEIGTFRAFNIPRSEVHGIELESRYTHESYEAGFSYTLQESRNLDTRRDLTRLPRHQGRIYGGWQPGPLPLQLSIEAIYRTGYFDDERATLRINDAWTLNAQASYLISPELRLYLRGENLSNDRTPDDYAFGKPGIGIYGGIRLSLR